jgi:mannonate dehydratase
MPFDQCWRWFGTRDPISLREVRQTGASGVVTALHEIPTGEIWTVEAIMARKRLIETEGLRWSVAESLPVHEEIKRGGPASRHFLENYQTSIRNLGKCGIRTLCYNFMPVLDWSRTDLEVRSHDGSITTAFHSHVLTAFDLFILKRPGARKEYDTESIREAESYFLSLDGDQREQLARTILLGFPGSGETYTLDQLRAALAEYRSITEAKFRDNLMSFLRQVVPVAEESRVLLALHPDDPPWPVLGLPRVVSTGGDVLRILSAIDSPSNGITLCTGSFGAGKRNDLVAMAEQFATRINFVHLRNVATTGDRDFVESNHLIGDVDMYGVIRALLLEQSRRAAEGRPDSSIPMRPDHGHLVDADRRDREYYPGYSLFGRMRGLAELRGLELGIRRSLGL